MFWPMATTKTSSATISLGPHRRLTAIPDYTPLHPGTLQGGRSRAICVAISRRTQNKDSFAAPKTLPFNDFLHFAPCALVRDLTAGPRCGSAV
jgi:hypothetical protein